ncbi:MAG: peptidylprolyl isomerase [Fimbriimonas sp.]|nr:peptidylprolyl isomerase [Fimbriimonas sp.]
MNINRLGLKFLSALLLSAMCLSAFGQGLKTGAPGATAPKTGEKVAVIDTNLGRIILKFFPDSAPNHVKNFEKLATKGFYDKTTFHRVIPGFMIQGGDPNTKPGATGMPGTGGPGYTVKAEFNKRHHGPGILSMARSQDPDSAGSQFFITVADAGSLDGQYTVFGQVVQGMDVVNKIVNLPRDQNDMPTPNSAVMTKVRIKTWPIKA